MAAKTGNRPEQAVTFEINLEDMAELIRLLERIQNPRVIWGSDDLVRMTKQADHIRVESARDALAIVRRIVHDPHYTQLYNVGAAINEEGDGGGEIEQLSG